MVKNYWRQICFAPEGASGGSPSGSEAKAESVTEEPGTGDGNLDVEFSIEDSQGIESIDDSLLMGQDPEAEAEAAKAADTSKNDDGSKDSKKDDDAKAAEAKAKEAAAESQSKDDKKDDKSSAESKSASSESKDDDSKASEKDDQKPPKGFVPLAAVQEVRGENKYLKERIKELEAKVDKSPAPAPKEEPKKKSALPEDFKVLSDSDFTKLADEDPKEALMYMKNLGIYQEEKRQEELSEQKKLWDAREAKENQEKTQAIFDATSQKMEEYVPGIFDKDSSAAEDLAKFADGLGFTEDMYYLTNPETQIILPGETEPLFLGEQAASIIQTLASARTKISKLEETKVDETKLREEITKEVEAKLRKDIEAEFLAKFKKRPDEESFRSLDSIPSSESPEFSGKVLSMAEFDKLSPQDQEAYLSGT